MKKRYTAITLSMLLVILTFESPIPASVNIPGTCHVRAEVVRTTENHDSLYLKVIQVEPSTDQGTCSSTKVSQIFRTNGGSNPAYIRKGFILDADVTLEAKNSPTPYLHWGPITIRHRDKVQDFPENYYLNTDAKGHTRPLDKCECKIPYAY